MIKQFDRVPLGRIADFVMGQSPPSSKVSDSPELGFPFLQGNAEFGAVHPNASLYCSLALRVAQENDLLISVRAPVGALNKADQEYIIGRGLAAIRFRSTTPQFGWHLLKMWGSRLDQVAQGSTFAAISKQNLAALSVLLPPKPEQNRIAAILDILDDCIIHTSALIDKLRAARIGLLHDLLTRGLDEHGQLRPTSEEVPESYHEKMDLGLVPLSWNVAPLAKYTVSSAFGPRFPGAAYSDEGNVATLRTTDLDSEGNLSLETMPLARLRLETYKSHILQPNDFLVTRSGTCGIASVFEGFRLPVLAGAFVIRFRFSEDLLPQFLRRYFNWSVGHTRVLKLAEGGVQKNLRGSALLRLSIPVPSQLEQVRILECLDAHDDQLHAEESQLAKLKSLRHGLIDDLLTGRVRVPATSEEVASDAVAE